MRNIGRLLAAILCMILVSPSILAQSSGSCPPPGTEVPFAKVMNEGFAHDYVGCDITTRVEFVAAGGTPNYYWGRVKGTDGKVPFRVVVPGEQVGGGPFDLPPHVFLPKDKADVIFDFKKGDLLIIRGAPSVGPKGIAIPFIATEVKKVSQ